MQSVTIGDAKCHKALPRKPNLKVCCPVLVFTREARVSENCNSESITSLAAMRTQVHQRQRRQRSLLLPTFFQPSFMGILLTLPHRYSQAEVRRECLGCPSEGGGEQRSLNPYVHWMDNSQPMERARIDYSIYGYVHNILRCCQHHTG